VFIGAGSRLGPGVRIADGAYVPVLTVLFPNQNLRKEEAPVEIPDAI
jgi:acetyltransferase-like isoleucine patch superfamily enzyme